MKKVLSLVLALAMVLGSFSFVSAAPMSDVAGTVYEEAVARLSLLEVLTGYPDGSFKPENTITRAEFAAVAVRAKGLESAANAAKGLATGFTDVAAGNWAAGYVGTAGKLGIVNGVGNGLFAPNAPVKYEEAVTMIVRALGYEASAQTKGGYPYGYLIVANEIGLLDQVKGTQGAPASRGIVAQIADNALEIPMMIQVGFGQDTKWVVSGSKEHGDNAAEQYLLDSLGFDSVLGRVTSVNSNRKGVTITVEDEDEIDRLGKTKVSISVPEGFDVYEVEGLETKFWYKGDIIITKVQEEAKYDAIKYISKDEEFELVTEDEEYEIADKKDGFIEIKINGEDYNDKDAKKVADYAKVVFNDDDEIIWAQGYSLDGFVVVDKVKDEVVYSADDYDEVDVEDFLIVKEGKEISVDDLKEGDVLYYNNNEEFAVVYNNSKEGKIDRVYVEENGIRFAGKNYDLAADSVFLNDEGKMGELESADLAEIADEKEEVTIFFNYHNEVALVLAGPESGTSAFYVMTKDANVYTGRNGQMLALDVRNSEGAKVTFDVDKDFVEKDKDYKIQGNNDGAITDYFGTGVIGDLNTDPAKKLEEGQVLKITLDKDGEPKEIVRMHKLPAASKIEVKDSKAEANGTDYRLKSNTVVFYDDLDEAILFGVAKDEFSEVEAGSTVYVEKGNVVAIVGKTDADSDTTTVSGYLQSITRIEKTDKYEFKVVVLGTTERYITESKSTISQSTIDSLTNQIVNLKIGDKSGEIKDIAGSYAIANPVPSVVVNTIRGRVINGQYTLNNNGVVYERQSNNTLKKIDLSDIQGKTVTLYKDGSSARYMNYIVVGASNTSETKIEYNVGTKLMTVTDAAYKAGDVDFLVKISGDALTTAVYSGVDSLVDENDDTLSFNIAGAILENGIYKVELLSAKDYRVILTRSQMYLPKN